MYAEVIEYKKNGLDKKIYIRENENYVEVSEDGKFEDRYIVKFGKEIIKVENIEEAIALLTYSLEK